MLRTLKSGVSGSVGAGHASYQVSDYAGRSLPICRGADWPGLAGDAVLTSVALSPISVRCKAMDFEREFKKIGIFDDKLQSASSRSICSQDSAQREYPNRRVCRERQTKTLTTEWIDARQIVGSEGGVTDETHAGFDADMSDENTRRQKRSNLFNPVERVKEPVTVANVLRKDGTDQDAAALLRFEPNLSSGFRDVLFEEPVGIAVNSDGVVAVADLAGDVIKLFSRQGSLIREISHYEKSNGKKSCLLCPAGLAFDHSDNLVVVERGRHRVTVITPEGKLVLGFGRRGKADGQLWLPHGVSVDSRGRIIVTDTGNSRVQVFTSEGELLLVFGKTGGAHTLNYPCYAVYREPFFYVSDTDNDCIKVFNSEGTFVRRFADIDQSDRGCRLSAPSGLAVVDDKYLLACDYNHDCVKVFTLDGVSVAKYGMSGRAVGQFSGPEALAALPNGNIVVTDKINRRVHSFGLVCNTQEDKKH